MPVTWPTCLTRRKQPSSSKRWLPPHTSTDSRKVLMLQVEPCPVRREAVRRDAARHQQSTDPSGSLTQRRMIVKQHVKNVVLVHGAFADGSGWKRVADILKHDGYKVSVVQHPETSYADDQKYTKAAIDAMGGPVVLVGHSYGGSVITEAGNHPNVASLVYIAAFA